MGKGKGEIRLVLDYLDSKIRGFGIISWIRWPLLLGFRGRIAVIRGFKGQLGLGFREWFVGALRRWLQLGLRLLLQLQLSCHLTIQ